jgi:hypothetical protein
MKATIQSVEADRESQYFALAMAPGQTAGPLLSKEIRK